MTWFIIDPCFKSQMVVIIIQKAIYYVQPHIRTTEHNQLFGKPGICPDIVQMSENPDNDIFFMLTRPFVMLNADSTII